MKIYFIAFLNLKQFHDSKIGGHLGVNKTIKHIQKQFRWKGMKDDVKNPFRPQTNGGLERSHRTLAEYLRHYVDKNLNNWDHLLPFAFFVYNSTVHTSTNFQPYALVVYGRTLEISIKLKSEPEPQYNYDDYLYDLKQSMQVSHKLAREKLIEHKVKSKERYDKNENPVDIHMKD
ncbi:hypothetical protein AGLY_002028 [Aphis glycines]|uniref:Integrase catalytic domain-containing protein n=1 Tax=Aphis glycines TaxID=307491 RepID=A0A6G0U3V1_APHGL|nr:hypothetical protein AGLY_002028 [Aphis glycines]